MRLTSVFIFLALACRLAAGPTPPELETALKGFRSEGPKGWAFTQTTTSAGKSLVERYEPISKNFLHWTLLSQDGREPTADEIQKYNERKTRRTAPDNAPNVKDQLAPDTCETVSETPEYGVYRFGLKPAGDDDTSARFMNVTFTLHRPSNTIEKVDLASTGPFSPVFLVKVREARTVMRYSLPGEGRPSLLQSVDMRIRGRAMWIRSLDQDLSVAYSDYEYAGRERPAPPSTGS